MNLSYIIKSQSKDTKRISATIRVAANYKEEDNRAAFKSKR